MTDKLTRAEEFEDAAAAKAWRSEIPSDVLLAVGLLKLLTSRGGDEMRETEQPTPDPTPEPDPAPPPEGGDEEEN